MKASLLKDHLVGLRGEDLQGFVLGDRQESGSFVPRIESTFCDEASVGLLNALIVLEWNTFVELDFLIFTARYDLVRLGSSDCTGE